MLDIGIYLTELMAFCRFTIDHQEKTAAGLYGSRYRRHRQLGVAGMMRNAVAPYQIKCTLERQRTENVGLLSAEIWLVLEQLLDVLDAAGTLVDGSNFGAELAERVAPASDPAARIQHFLAAEPAVGKIRILAKELDDLPFELRVAEQRRALGYLGPTDRKSCTLVWPRMSMSSGCDAVNLRTAMRRSLT